MTRSTRCSIVLALVAMALPVPASADGPPQNEELLARYRPSFADTLEQATTDPGRPLPGFATATADAHVGGVLESEARVDGTFLEATGGTGPTARAVARVIAPGFDWSGNQLRVEARFTYSLEFTQSDEVVADTPGRQWYPGDETVRISVHTGLQGVTPWVWTEPWSAREGSPAGFQVLADGRQVANGTGVVSTYVRAPCAGTTLSPFVETAIEVALPKASVRRSARGAQLSVYVSEMTVYRDTVMPCHRVADIKVLDNSFSPADVTVQRFQKLRFDYTGASNYHDVLIPWHGSPYPGAEIEANFQGTWIYYCKVHGTPAGDGMAGTITVT